jgi:hypothetical protein
MILKTEIKDKADGEEEGTGREGSWNVLCNIMSIKFLDIHIHILSYHIAQIWVIG